MIKFDTKEKVLKLFKELKVNYITNYIIEFELINNIQCKESPYYIDNINEFEKLTDIYGKKISERYINEVYISKTEKKGYGLFASIPIKENDFIGVYLGIIREEDELVAYDETGYDTDYAWDYPDEIEGFPNLEINAKYSGNELRFANHDKNPNIRVEHTVVDNQWYIFFLADRDINKNEELTISYGEAYWDTEYRSLN